jgi:DNA-binding IclR family transcriptional regulator
MGDPLLDEVTPEPRPSRAEIERLCLLKAIGDGSSLSAVAQNLGLSPQLAHAIRHALQTLIEAGFVEASGDRVSPTEEGVRYLRERVGVLLSPAC